MSGLHQIARARMLANLSTGWGEHTSDQYHFNTEKFNKEYSNRLRTQWTEFDQLDKDKVVKLGVVMLVCAYYEDDGELSYMEKASLENLIKNEGFLLTEEEKNELLSFQENHVNVANVVSYIKRYNLSEMHVHQALNLVNNIVVIKEYRNTITEIFNQYENQK